MSIPRAKIRLGFYVPMASWECALLDVPCGTAVPGYWSECPECGYSDDWWTWDLAANDALSHLRAAHGVRTVGSLTADDIGKWIELPDREPFKLAETWHDRHLTTTFASNGGPGATALRNPSSVVCRVIEARQ